MTNHSSRHTSMLVCLTLKKIKKYVENDTQIEASSATQQCSACCAHASKLRGLGVHIKLIKSVVEIMVCCRPGTSVQWLGRLLIFRWQGGSG